MITLPNGVTLDEAGAKDLAQWALRKGVPNIRAFVTSNNTYLLVENTTPIFETTRFEDAAVHIDIMALDRLSNK